MDAPLTSPTNVLSSAQSNCPSSSATTTFSAAQINTNFPLRGYAQRLPNELLGIIFEYCGERERMAAASACQRWRAVAISHRWLWRFIHFSTASSTSVYRRTSTGQLLQPIFEAWKTIEPSVPDIMFTGADALDAILSRNALASAQLYISALTASTPNCLANSRAALSKNAGRLAGITILFHDLADLDDLGVFPESKFIAGTRSFRIVHVDNPEFDFASLMKTGVDFVQPLAPCGQKSIQSMRTSCLHTWEHVLPRAYPNVTALELHVFDIGDVRAALRACPRLKTLIMYISGALDGASVGSEDVPAELRTVSILGTCVDATCMQVLLTLAGRAKEVVVECAQFWSGVTALFDNVRLSNFEHVPWGHGMQKVRTVDDRGHTRDIRANIEEEATYEWVDFYKTIHASIAHIELDGKVPEEYFAILLDPNAEVYPSGDALTWHGQLFSALDDA